MYVLLVFSSVAQEGEFSRSEEVHRSSYSAKLGNIAKQSVNIQAGIYSLSTLAMMIQPPTSKDQLL